MKRNILITLTLASAMIIGLCACDSSTSNTKNPASSASVVSSVTAENESRTVASEGSSTSSTSAGSTQGTVSGKELTEEEAEGVRDSGELLSDPKTGYEYVDGTNTWYYSNYPYYKDFNEDGVVKVAFVCKFSGAWFTPKNESLKKTVEGAGYQYLYIDANSDEQAWLDGIKNVINQDFDIVVMTPVNTALLPDAIQMLQDSGIAYMTTDDPGADAYGFYSPHYGLDDYYLHNELGKLAAKSMEARDFMAGVKSDYSNFLFVLEDSPSVESIHKRNQGFYDAIMEVYPNIPTERVVWLDCGTSLSDEVMEKFSSTLQANIGSVDKWIVSAGGAASVVPTITLFQEQNVDLNDVIMADCFSTSDPFEMMMKDPDVAKCCFGAALASAPSGVGMGNIIIDLVKNGTPIPGFTGYDFIGTTGDNVKEIYNEIYGDA